MMDNIRFAHPQLLWLMTLIVPLVGYYIYRTIQGGASISVASIAGVEKAPKTAKYYLRHLPFVVRMIAFVLLVTAIARPQSSEYNSRSNTYGIDMVISLDVSTSMLARDFQPDRIAAAKEMAANFINDRPNDRIGLVIFASESFTQCPLTTDNRSLLGLLSQVQCGTLEDGTAIGNGLATAVNRLKDSQAKSKVIILLTDGVNNSGQIAPLSAAEIAQTYGIKVYTIGVGTMGMAPYPTYDMWGEITYVPVKVEIDEKMLQQIATQTGGKYFRATDNSKLKAIYEEIGQMEQTKIEVSDFTSYNELFWGFAMAALLLLLAEFLIKNLWLRQIP